MSEGEWKQVREVWGLWSHVREEVIRDKYGDPVAFESVEEAKAYALQKGLVRKDEELATTADEASREGVRVVIIPIRILTRSV